MNIGLDNSDSSYIQAYLAELNQSDENDQTSNVNDVTSNNSSISDVGDPTAPVTKEQIQEELNRLHIASCQLDDEIDSVFSTSDSIKAKAEAVINEQKKLQQMLTQYQNQGVVGDPTADSVADHFQSLFTSSIDKFDTSSGSSFPSFIPPGGNYAQEVDQISNGITYNACDLQQEIDQWGSDVASSLGLKYNG